MTVRPSRSGLPITMIQSPTRTWPLSPSRRCAQPPLGRHLDQRQVGGRVGAAHLRRQLARVVADGDHQLAGALDDVVVGGDQAVAADHEAAASRLGAELLRRLRPALRARLVAAARTEEEVEEGVVLAAAAAGRCRRSAVAAAVLPGGVVAAPRRRLLEAHRADGHHGGRHRLGEVGEAGQPAAAGVDDHRVGIVAGEPQPAGVQSRPPASTTPKATAPATSRTVGHRRPRRPPSVSSLPARAANHHPRDSHKS